MMPQQAVAVPMILLLSSKCLGKCTGISFIDPAHLKVCHNRPIYGLKVFKEVAHRGLAQMITKSRQHMKEFNRSQTDKILLRKRAVIECVNEELKNLCKVQHTRHSSINKFQFNVMGALCAYALFKRTLLFISSLKIKIINCCS